MHKELLTAAAMLLLAGCSTFNREWKAALEKPVPPDSITGAWEGRWLSGKNAHTGRLRCVMSAVSTNEYDAFFHATFWKIFHASYRVPLRAEASTNGVNLSGEADLGKLSGGIYQYEATVTPLNFAATYKSKYDRGTFEMRRPAGQ